MNHASGRHFLQIPGPTNVPDRVLRAMAAPTIDHRGPELGALGRELLAGAGAVAAVASLPVALAAAAPAVGEKAPRATLSDWHIDDMWGVCPRPSEPIGFGRPHGDGELVAAVHPADQQFLCA
jgi:hypothetical protein